MSVFESIKRGLEQAIAYEGGNIAMARSTNLLRISESDGWVVDYDRERGMYRVSYSEDGIWSLEHWFDCYEEKELKTPEEIIELYWKTFLSGAAEFMQYMKNNYSNGIFPSEMEDALIGFTSQFGEVRDVNT